LNQKNRNTKAAQPTTTARTNEFIFLLVLAAVLGLLFCKSFLPDYVHFSNDGPLGEQNTTWSRLPAALTGLWDDLNDIGTDAGASTLDITSFAVWLLGPVGYAKFYVPIVLFILGTGAWTFFRQLKLSPLAAGLGALAVALNSAYVGNACWGTAPQQIAMAAVFFALALVMANTDETPRPIRWIRLALAGMCVGISVMEGADNGAIFSLFVAAFVFFKSLLEENKPALEKVGRGIGRVVIIAFFALFIAAQTVASLVGTYIVGSSGAGPDKSETPQHHWDWATEWSLPKKETLGVFVPGLFGYRMDTPKNMMDFAQDSYKNGEYWGGMGREPAIDRFFDSGAPGSAPGGLMRFGYAGYYCGILVALIGLFAMIQSFRKENSIFPHDQRRLIWFWMVTLIIALLLSWGRFAPFYHFLYVLPYFSTIRNPAKFMAIFYLALAIIFAYGVDGLSRRYLRVATSKSSSLSNWWANVRGFDRNWTIFSVAAFGASVVAWFVYASKKAALVSYLQKVGFPDEGAAKAIAAFSIGQAGWFLLFFAASVLLVILVLAGVFSGKRATIGGLLLGALLVTDLSRANLPWIIHWDYKQKYDIDPTNSANSTNPVINFLRDKSYEHRVTDLSSDSLFEEVYRIEWMQHHFPYYNIQCLDIIQSPRTSSDLIAYKIALSPMTEAQSYLLARRWQLSNTRYILGPAGYVDSVNNQLDPGQRRFHIIQRFNIVPKPGVDVDKLQDALQHGQFNGEELTAVPDSNGEYALFEFTGALPRAKLYTNWQTNSAEDLKNFTDKGLSDEDSMMFNQAGTNGFLTLKKLTSPDFDAEQTVLLDAPLAGANPNHSTNGTSGTVDFKSYSPKEIVLNAHAAGPSVLMLNDRFDPNWKVFVDGAPAQLLRCNYIMRGVFLPPGSHTVEFQFALPHKPLYITLIAIFLGVVLVGALFLLTHQNTPTEKK
jgi:hypothetical protein